MTLARILLPYYGNKVTSQSEDISRGVYKKESWSSTNTLVQGIGLQAGPTMDRSEVARVVSDLGNWAVGSRLLIVIDLSIPSDMIKHFQQNGWRVVVIDHHASAPGIVGEEFAASEDFIYSPNELSGAGLALKWIDDLKLAITAGERRLIQYVQDRDLWTWKLPLSRAVSNVITHTKLDPQAWSSLVGRFSTEFAEVANEGYAMQTVLDEQLRRLTGNNLVAWIPVRDKIQVPIVNTPILISEIGEIMAQKGNNPLGLAIMWYVTAQGNIACSFRSREKDGKIFDCAKFAEKFGGGGHKPAAGCSFRSEWEMRVHLLDALSTVEYDGPKVDRNGLNLWPTFLMAETEVLKSNVVNK